MCNHNVILKMASPYYSQIQGELTGTKRSYFDLFIFSFIGNLTVRVNYNHSHWEKLCQILNGFGKNLLPRNF